MQDRRLQAQQLPRITCLRDLAGHVIVLRYDERRRRVR
jgi:hypothetical protein